MSHSYWQGLSRYSRQEDVLAQPEYGNIATEATLQRSERDLSLEALRGLAAIVVVLWHTILAFFPNRVLPSTYGPMKPIFREAWFGLVHGSAAVTFFFVLSGFVLTRACFITNDGSIVRRGAIKRWPRLAGPATAATLISWGLYALGFYHFEEAGRIVGSPWLTTFASTHTPSFVPQMWTALSEGAFYTFFRGDHAYDQSLWTMRYEFIGSFVAYGLVLLLLPVHRSHRLLTAGLVAVTAMTCHFVSPYFVAFPAGVALAAFLPRERMSFPAWASILLMIAGLYMWGYTAGARGIFHPIRNLLGVGTSPIYSHMLGSVLLIIGVETSARLRRALSGRWAVIIGELSFPIYLIHLPVIASLGSIVLILAASSVSPPYANILAAAVTIVGSVVCAIPLAWFNRWWTKVVNTGAAWTLRNAS
jgi:peptidoglycan/LPS O-acetylase OafA/YrhL